MKCIYILTILLIYACSPSSIDPDYSESEMTDEDVREEVDNVDAMLLKDKQRLDSMQKVLIEGINETTTKD